MINRLLIELYAIDAEKEVETKKKRQAEGYAAKRLRGEWDDIGTGLQPWFLIDLWKCIGK